MDAVKPLNYAPKPPAARRVWRWVYRLIFAVATIVAAVVWGPGIWRRAASIYWEQKCLAFLEPPSHVVLDTNPSANVFHSEVCIPRSRFEESGSSPPNPSDCTIFLHEMRRPDGRRCLMLLTYLGGAPVGPVQLEFQYAEWNVSLSPQLTYWNIVYVPTDRQFAHLTFFAGQPDTNNPSHFTFDFNLDGMRHTCDAWLDNDGKLIVSQRP
jgi:hypothetical protein